VLLRVVEGKPLWQAVAEAAEALPADIVGRLPEDGAEQHAATNTARIAYNKLIARFLATNNAVPKDLWLANSHTTSSK
jgi:hypothetical protein